MLVAYMRVSTIEHKISEKSAKRPKFEEMMNFLREGDELIVSEFSRLARSTTDLLNILETSARQIYVDDIRRNSGI